MYYCRTFGRHDRQSYIASQPLNTRTSLIHIFHDSCTGDSPVPLRLNLNVLIPLLGVGRQEHPTLTGPYTSSRPGHCVPVDDSLSRSSCQRRINRPLPPRPRPLDFSRLRALDQIQESAGCKPCSFLHFVDKA